MSGGGKTRHAIDIAKLATIKTGEGEPEEAPRLRWAWLGKVSGREGGGFKVKAWQAQSRYPIKGRRKEGAMGGTFKVCG